MQGLIESGSHTSVPPLNGSGATYLKKWPQIAPFLTVEGRRVVVAALRAGPAGDVEGGEVRDRDVDRSRSR